MNGHSIERMAPGQLDFRISHRFGPINSGAYELFGLDQANTHFSLEYGILKWLMAGVGRGTYEKTFDGFAKFSLLRQSSGAKEMPVSVSLLSSVAVKSEKSRGFHPNLLFFITVILCCTGTHCPENQSVIFGPAYSFIGSPESCSHRT